MAKIYGMHEIELHLGVKGEDFERFFQEQVASALAYPGWRLRLLKGDKGFRDGQYMLLFEIESEAARDRFVLPSGETTQAAIQFEQAHKENWNSVFTQWATFSPTPFGRSPTYTDYIMLDASA